jgi:hypothetical protein
MAAGLVFIAGCAGGGHASPSGGALPNVPQSGGKKIALSFTIPRTAGYLSRPPQPSPLGKNRRSAQSVTQKMTFVRKPKFLGFGALGGYIVLDIYQNGQLASYQYLTLGFENSNADLFCYEAPPNYFSLSCYNLVNIYAPGGNDTFYAASYDSQYRLISLTPGFPGTSVYGTPPASVTIPSSSAVNIQMYGVPASIYIDTPTSCVSPYSAGFHISDADGDLMVGPLAYPVTISASTFDILYAGQSLGTSVTTYTTDVGVYSFAAPGYLSGQTTTVSAHTPAGSLAVNFSTMYSVDHTAFTVSTSGLYALGLINGGASSYQCGQVALNSLYTGQPLTFTNPVGMSQDGSNALLVLDDVGSNPVVDVILANDLFISPSIVPVAQVPLASTGAEDIAASMNDQAYVVNADGTIHRVDYSLAVAYAFNYTTGNDSTIALGLSAPAGSSVSVFSVGTSDYVFATSYGSSSVYEVDNANSGSPAGNPFNLAGLSINGGGTYLSSSVITTATTTDNSSLYVAFRAFDSGLYVNQRNVIVSCTLVNVTPCLSDQYGNSIDGNFGAAGSLATVYTGPVFLETDGSTITRITENGNGTSNFGVTFSPNPTRIVTSPDGIFEGTQSGGSFTFAPAQTESAVGSLSGTVSAIWNSPFF